MVVVFSRKERKDFLRKKRKDSRQPGDEAMGGGQVGFFYKKNDRARNSGARRAGLVPSRGGAAQSLLQAASVALSKGFQQL